MSKKDCDLYEKKEDRRCAEEGRKALEEFKRSGKKPVPWEKIKERLGL